MTPDEQAVPVNLFPQLWDLDTLQHWVGSAASQPGDLALGFFSLRRCLVETDDPAVRSRSIQLTHTFLDQMEVFLRRKDLSQDQLALSFAILMTLIGEAGPYRYETKKDADGKIWQEILGPMEKIRIRCVALAKMLFARSEFDLIRQPIDREVIPLVEAAVEVHAGEHDRFMPFRINQIGNVAERLLELSAWLQIDAGNTTEGQTLLGLLKKLYDLKYCRFGTSGLRGRWGFDFTIEKAQYTAQAICLFMSAEDMPGYVVPKAQPMQGKWVVIGYDGRRNSMQIADKLGEVALRNGYKVAMGVRPTPTPVLAFYATEHLGKENVAGIINCTASHNPPDWQGIKFNPKEGYSAPTHLTDVIASRINEMQLLHIQVPTASIPQAETAGKFVYFDGMAKYWDWIKNNGKDNQRIPLNLERIRQYFKDKLVIVDEMHGSSQGYMGHILGELGIPKLVLHPERDIDLGGLDYANPELPYVQPLMDAVKEHAANLGMGMDTDGDRYGVVDQGGAYFRPNQILAMLSYYLAVERKEKGRIAITQTGLPMINAILERAGMDAKYRPADGVIPAYVDHAFYKRRVGEREDMSWKNVFVVPVGIKYLVEIPRMDNAYKLVDEEILGPSWMDHLLLGGEESSGLTTRGHVPDKDGIWANLLIMDMIAHYGKTLAEIWSDLTSLPEAWAAYGGRVDVDASDGAKERLISGYLDSFKGKKPGEVEIAGYPVLYAGGIRYDLVEIFLGDAEGKMRNFLRIRSSGTEPINRVYAETNDPKLWETLQNIVMQKLDGYTLEEIDMTYRLHRLVDILATTKPGNWDLVKAGALKKLESSNWSLADMKKELEIKHHHAENRNKEVIDGWLERL